MVRLCTHRKTREQYAGKCLRYTPSPLLTMCRSVAKIVKLDKHSKYSNDDDVRQCLLQEIDILRQFGTRHPHIVSLLEVYEDRNKIVLVFEL